MASTEKQKQSSRLYAQTHPDKVRVMGQVYRQTHPEEMRAKRKKWNDAHPEQARYSLFKAIVKRKGRPTTLSLVEFLDLTSRPCFYCGGVLPTFGYGIDRVDPKIGYVQGNCRPCCSQCNIAKNDWTETEFKEWAARLFNNWANN